MTTEAGEVCSSCSGAQFHLYFCKTSAEPLQVQVWRVSLFMALPGFFSVPLASERIGGSSDINVNHF